MRSFIPVFWERLRKLLKLKDLREHLDTIRPFHIRKRAPLSAKVTDEDAVKWNLSEVDGAKYTSTRTFYKSLRAFMGYPLLWGALRGYCRAIDDRPFFLKLRKLSLFLRAKPFRRPAKLGKLGIKEEPGKKRVFAMVDPITQWALYPLHSLLMGFLRKVPQDATFDQEGGVERVRICMEERVRKGQSPSIHSFDLSAATDRLPLLLQELLLDALFPGLGRPWATLLVGRAYYLNGHPIKYNTGQPMGAYSSWAMLAITHHYIVQLAAKRAGFHGWFTDYMVLGDDIVIFNDAVAAEYLKILEELGVAYSPTKSLTSKTGVFEFAKKFVDPKGSLAGLPLAELSASKFSLTVMFETLRRFEGGIRMADALRLMGFGFKVRGKSDFARVSVKRSEVVKDLLFAPGLTRSSKSS